jgi:hypothetical protein
LVFAGKTDRKFRTAHSIFSRSDGGARPTILLQCGADRKVARSFTGGNLRGVFARVLAA